MPAASIEIMDEANCRDAIERELFGGPLTDGDYAALAGVCLDNVSLVVHFDYDLTGVRFPLCLRASRADDFSTRILFDTDVATLDSISVKPELRKQGIAWETFYHQARTAASHNFSVIRAKALRIPEGSPLGMHDGYIKSIRWGFNAPIPNAMADKLTDGLEDATSVADLMDSESGREFWLTNGCTIAVEFNLSDDSPCWDVLGMPDGARNPTV